MKRVKIKICGITNTNDAMLAVELGADAVGFIFTESPRRVDPEKAAAIIAELPEHVVSVGVFVNQPVAEVKAIADYCGLGMLQLHGDESMAYCRSLEPDVIKAFRMQTYCEIDEWMTTGILSDVDNIKAFLLDSFSSTQRGGTGLQLDWNRVRHLNSPKPLYLAGGLNSENVAEAIRTANPFAVDVSSGVEMAPGKKDPEKLRTLMRIVRELQ